MKVVPAEHTHHDRVESLVWRRKGGRDRCTPKPTMTHVQLRLVMCTRNLVLYVRLVDARTTL